MLLQLMSSKRQMVQICTMVDRIGIYLNLLEITFHTNIHVVLKFIFQIVVMTMNLIVHICHFKG